MAFWTYCCKFPQVHRYGGPRVHTQQYPNPRSFSDTKYPQLPGAPRGDGRQWAGNLRPIDNEGDWKCLSDFAGIRNDGTLWCWIPEIVVFKQIMEGAAPPRESWAIPAFGESYTSRDVPHDAPTKISDDADWKYVTSGRHSGFAIKEDGTLWAFGRNSYGHLGIGSAKDGDFGKDFQISGRYKARLSCAIESVQVRGFEVFSKKPIPEIRYYQTSHPYESVPSELGSGAEVEVDWTGSVHDDDVVVTSGGSGYGSPPTVRLVPAQGATEDVDKVIFGSVTEMTPAYISMFEPLAGGGGYTYATAVESFTGARASAAIEDGMIVGWSITHPGSPVDITSPYNLSVKITGDGAGAAAGAILGTSSVVSVSFPEAKIWTETPVIQFSGGGGTGAAATVAKILGEVDAIRVINGGTGYTQSDFELRVVLIRAGGDHLAETRPEEHTEAYITLAPGQVSEFVVVGDPPELMKASTGTLSPFTAGFGFASSVELFSPYIDSVPLEKTPEGYFRLNEEIHGCTYPPFVLVTANGDELYYASGRSLAAPTEVPQVWKKTTANVCDGTPSAEYAALKNIDWPWPIAESSVTATSTNGQTATYVNVGGELKLVSRNWVPLQFTFDRATVSWSPTPTLYSGPAHAYVDNITTRVYGSAVNIWSPPTTEEVLRLYTTPPTHGGAISAYGEVRPDESGFGSSPTLIDEGGLYVLEPHTLEASGSYEYPVQVGEDTWKSVSLDDFTQYNSKTFGVTESGLLYWWGKDTANGSAACTFPSPVGQGVAIDVLPPEGESEFKSNLSNQSAYISVPDHGIHFASVPSPALPGYGRWSYSYGYDLYYGDAPKTVYRPDLPGLNRYFAPPPNFATVRDGLIGNARLGLGYVSEPSVTQLTIGEQSHRLEARLVGETSFERVSQGGYAMSSDGTWYLIGPSAYIDAPREFYSYTTEEEFRRGRSLYATPYTSPSQFDADVYTSTREVQNMLYPFYAFVSRSGAGYTSASLEISFTSPLYSAVDSVLISDDTVYVPCGGSSVPLVQKYTRSETQSVQPQTVVSDGIQVSPRSGMVSPDWRIVDTAAWLTTDTATARIIGDGEGAEAGVCVISSAVVSPMRPESPPGTAHFWGSSADWPPHSWSVSYGSDGSGGQYSTSPGRPSNYTLNESGEVSWLFYGPYGTYTSTIAPSGFSEVSPRGALVRRGDDGSLWKLREDYPGWFWPRMAWRAPASPIERVFPLSIEVSSTGSGYDRPATAITTRAPGVAAAEVEFDARVSGIGLINAGSGYSSPPAVLLAPADGIGDAGTATATIAGPIDKVTVTATGTGYRRPPRVVFTGAGSGASATCELNGAGGIASVSISSGGRYRNTPPAVSFEPVVEVESLSLTNGGSGYTSAPRVYIGGGGGVGAEATCRLRAQVVEIVLTSPGGGYTSVPDVIIEGGATAIAGISFANGTVTGITLQNHGDYYQFPPRVEIVGGGGTGAAAVAKISGYVDQITLTKRGEDYVFPPQVVFYDGGGGTGAAATAAIAGAGSGATAVARLDGSVIFCTHGNDSSGLQVEPVVNVTDDTNYKVAEALQSRLTGEITQDEFERTLKAVSAKAAARIVGSVAAVNVTDGGGGYRQTSYWSDDSVTLDDSRIPAVATFLATHCANPTNMNVVVEVSEDGSISSVPLPPHEPEFTAKPEIVFADGIAAIPWTCLTMVGAAVESAGVITYHTASWYGLTFNGAKVLSGGIDSNDLLVSLSGSLAESTGSFLGSDVHLFDYDNNRHLFYDPTPNVSVEDEAGTGASLSMSTSAARQGGLVYGGDSFFDPSRMTVISGGSNYTSNARVVITGGSPKSWSNKATATTSISGGAVTGVSVSSPGSGYMAVPDVIIHGGGGEGARAVATLSSSGAIASIAVTAGGSGYTSQPSVTIVDKDRPFEMTSIGERVQRALDERHGVPLKDYRVEWCAVRQPRQETIISSMSPTLRHSFGASFVPIFRDDGYVEGVHWFAGRLCGFRDFEPAPTVTATPGETADPATYSTSVVRWSDVMSDHCLKTESE